MREPNALKIEATCTPVAPPPTTSIDDGTEVKAHASLWVLVNSKPRIGSRRLTPPVQMTTLSAESRVEWLSRSCGSRQSARSRHSHGLLRGKGRSAGEAKILFKRPCRPRKHEKGAGKNSDLAREQGPKPD